ncbi:hypothetical protein [Pseudonocardia sp.]|uniref:hypothetical protein n=1 Tax=Pseudonocardia sp. TaxID=60912 RepID=UPI003D0ED4BB
MIALNVDERGGSPSVEAAVLAVVVGLLIAFAIAGGRLVVLLGQVGAGRHTREGA